MASVMGIIAACICLAGAGQPLAEWKDGLSTVAITPAQSLWMAVSAARSKPSEGKVHVLRA